MDETTHPPRPRPGGALPAAEPLLWASLVPLALLLRPYAGIAQDARIYLGRALADRDPAGLGADAVFAHDGQNGFSVMARAAGLLLRVMTPEAASFLLAAAGLAAWLLAAAALARRLAAGRTAWAIVVALLALPGLYGGFGTFSYGESLATPRTLAEAAVLAAFAALLSGRSWLGLALVAGAVVTHPLMALPGAAVAAVMLVHADRRWLLPIGAGIAAVLAAALLGAPVLGRLLVPFDPAWAAVLRMRSVNLFPSLWAPTVYLGIARRLATALLAASLLAGRARALVLAGCGVALAGLAVAALFGDAVLLELVTQVQPWRALWLLAVMGNAGVAIAVPRLWRGGDLDRLTLAVLAIAWLADDVPVLEGAATAAVLALRVAAFRGWAPRLPRRLLAAAALVGAALALFDVVQSVMVTAVLLRAAWAQGGEAAWHLAVDADLPTVPVMVAALALACAPRERLRGVAASRPRLAAAGGAAALATACALGLLAFDQTSAERGAAHHTEAAAALRAAIGPVPGEVMWIDEDDENWFLAGRPAFFDTVQGAPILFSRALALDWADRAAAVRALGWAREIDISPWTSPARRLDPILLKAADLETFCRNPRRPAAVVAPGAQLGAVPAGWTAALWRPAEPLHRMWIDDGAIRWARWDAFTVVRCPLPPAAGGAAQGRDARSLG